MAWITYNSLFYFVLCAREVDDCCAQHPELSSHTRHDDTPQPQLSCCLLQGSMGMGCARGSGGTNDDRTRTLGTDGHPLPPPNPESAIGGVWAMMIPRDLDAMRSCGHQHGRKTSVWVGLRQTGLFLEDEMEPREACSFFFLWGGSFWNLSGALFYGVFLVVVET